ncbi:unnamed protein product [Amoebophrya sp. A120]|nr:unnamed protein product [Amoebophrya sp. A120]|eukprot:GSA120T00003175001.1
MPSGSGGTNSGSRPGTTSGAGTTRRVSNPEEELQTQLQHLLISPDADIDHFFENGPTFLETFLGLLQDRLHFRPNVIHIRGDRIPSVDKSNRDLAKDLFEAAKVEGFAGEKDTLRIIEKYFDEKVAVDRSRVRMEGAQSLHPQDIPGTYPVGWTNENEEEEDSDEFDVDDMPGFVHPNTRKALARLGAKDKADAKLKMQENTKKVSMLKSAPIAGKAKESFSDDELDFKDLLAKVGQNNPSLTMKYVLPFFQHLNFDNMPKLTFLRIPSSFERLSRVSLNRCSLTSLAPDLLAAPQLEQLSLYNNSISRVKPFDPSQHKRNKQLKFLGLGSNFLEGPQVEEICEWFSALLVLDVSFNFVVDLDAFNESLMRIDLTGNPLSFAPDLKYLLADMFPRATPPETIRELESGKFAQSLLGKTTATMTQTLKAAEDDEPQTIQLDSIAHKPVPVKMTVVSGSNLHLLSTDTEVLSAGNLHLKIDVPDSTSPPVYIPLTTTGDVPDLAALSAAVQDPEQDNPESSQLAFDTNTTEWTDVYSPAQICSWIVGVPYIEIGYSRSPSEEEVAAVEAEQAENPDAPAPNRIAKYFTPFAGASIDVQRWLWDPRKPLNNLCTPLVLCPDCNLPKNRMPHLRAVQGPPGMQLHLKMLLDYSAC